MAKYYIRADVEIDIPLAIDSCEAEFRPGGSPHEAWLRPQVTVHALLPSMEGLVLDVGLGKVIRLAVLRNVQLSIKGNICPEAGQAPYAVTAQDSDTPVVVEHG